MVRSLLSSLKLAIAGTVVMSSELAEGLDALFLARVPTTWTKTSQLLVPTLGVWFTNIISRAEQLTAWLRGGRPNCFWLSGFFNPQGFLTANRQEVHTCDAAWQAVHACPAQYGAPLPRLRPQGLTTANRLATACRCAASMRAMDGRSTT